MKRYPALNIVTDVWWFLFQKNNILFCFSDKNVKNKHILVSKNQILKWAKNRNLYGVVNKSVCF